MTRPLFYGSILGCAALAAIAVSPVEARTKTFIEVTHPWIAQPPGGAPTAAGYLTLKNVGKGPDVFLGGETGAAEALEIHSMSMTGGVMRMRAVPEGLDLQPGQILTLHPGGDEHLMIIHPTHALKAGESIPATLHFRRAGSLRVTFLVQTPEAAPTPKP